MRVLSKLLLAVLVVLLVSSTGLAATDATNTNTVYPTLVISVNVQKAVRLTLAAGTMSGTCFNTGGGGDYNIAFGTVDALGIADATCGSKYAPTNPGTDSAKYYTDYKLQPVFTSQDPVSGTTITATVSSPFSLANLSVVQANSPPTGSADLTLMGTGGSQTSVVSPAASKATYTRYIGVAVAPDNGAGLIGTGTATITYTLTVQ
jgi:hypothetical protein